MTDKFKKGSNDNVLFVTSACSNRCIMCCQPPKYCDDSEQLFQKNLSVIASADVDTDYVCITGGEPTLIGDKLFIYMHNIWERMSDAEIHLLTNGRKYADVEYLTAFVKNVKGNMVLGIPLHSDNPIDHDYIASAKDSFYETMKGLHNLGLLGFNIELRVILLQQNYQRLPKIAEFISLNLPFVSQVSIMGLEITGYANLPLCLLPQQLWEYACRSISDWKQTYLAACEKCKVKEKCCGMFSTSKWYSCFIRPVL